MITREQCLKWAEEAEQTCEHPYSYTSYVEALCQRVWDEAIEAAAKLVDERYDSCEPWLEPYEVRKLKGKP